MKALRSQQGFTILELVIVMVIIGVLAGVGVPKYLSMKAQADEAANKANKSAIQAAIMNKFVQDRNRGKAVTVDNLVKEYNQNAKPFFPGNKVPTPPAAPTKKYKAKVQNSVIVVYY